MDSPAQPIPLRVTPEEVEKWLQWAGMMILSMPGRPGPAAVRAAWPFPTSDDPALAKGYASARKRSRLLPQPSSAELPIMDEILVLPLHIIDERRRKIVQMRSLINPRTGLPVHGWMGICDTFELKRRDAKELYSLGLRRITTQVDLAQSVRIRRVLEWRERRLGGPTIRPLTLASLS